MSTPAVDVPMPFRSRSAIAEAYIAQGLPGYTPRPAQQRLMQAVERLFDDCRPVLDDKGKVVEEKPPQWLLAEAGTGTGKSLGVLIPAIVSEIANGGRVIVSTATLALMAQYVRKDLPLLQRLLPVDFKWALLKGLSNYACAAKLETAMPYQVHNLEALRKELEEGPESHSGDRDDIVTELDANQWSLVSSTTDECPGRSVCAFADQCFGLEAKDQASKADLVVTSTKMIFVDVAARMQARENSPEGKDPGSFIIGKRTAMILDEGHTAADIAAETLGFDLREGGIRWFAAEAVSFVNIHGGAQAGAEQMEEVLLASADRVGELLAAYIELAQNSDKLDVRTDKPVLTAEFIGEYFEFFKNVYYGIGSLWAAVNRASVERGSEHQEVRKRRLQATASNMVRSLQKILMSPDIGMIAYPEMHQPKNRDGTLGDKRWILKARLVDVGPTLREELWSRYPSVLVSATFSTGGGAEGFRYMARTLGLNGARTLNVGTPFDYPRQGLVYYPPSGTAAPTGGTRAMWQSWATEASLMLIRSAGGGAMMLYTSVKDMRAAHAVLAPKLAADGLASYVQGDGLTNQEIADRFRADEDAVLFGTKTFFTGVDFPGWTNRLVVISKMPFAVPSEPLYAAKKRRIDEANPNDAWASMKQLAVPMMDLELRQAVGRLIRTGSDVGVVAILDPRLGTTSYGKRIRATLPSFPQTTDLADVERFFQEQRALRAA